MDFFKNIKLGKKISLITASFLISMVIVGTASISQMSYISSKVTEISTSRIAPIISLEDTKTNIEYIRNESSTLRSADTTSAQNQSIKNISDKISVVNSELTQYKNKPEFNTLFKDYKKFLNAKDKAIKEILNMKKDQEGAKNTTSKQGTFPGNKGVFVKGAGDSIRNFDKVEMTLTNDFNKIVNTQSKATKQAAKDSQAAFKGTVIGLIVLLIICVCVTSALSFIIIKSITVPVKKVTAKLKEISQDNGNLTQRIGYHSKDEIGQLSHNFDLFMDKLHSIIGEVAASADTIASSSNNLNSITISSTNSLKEIAGTVSDIASGTAEEAAAIEETTASLAEAANFSEATSNSSKNTSYNSKKAKEAAENGAEKISQIVSSITEIAESSKEVSVMIGDLSSSSKKIGDIIAIITSIAEQTNLLALNAAIEAARAGEAGKGFNVVAEEIRKLADESKKAASEISQLVSENQLKSDSAVSSFENVEQKVKLGVNQASEVGESIQYIIKNIQGIVEEIDHINEANEQQSDSTKEIEKAIGNIAVTTNEVADKTDHISKNIGNQLNIMTEIETSATQLSVMVEKLNSITSGFVV